jgi:hypothetical protein
VLPGRGFVHLRVLRAFVVKNRYRATAGTIGRTSRAAVAIRRATDTWEIQSGLGFQNGQLTSGDGLEKQ